LLRIRYYYLRGGEDREAKPPRFLFMFISRLFVYPFSINF